MSDHVFVWRMTGDGVEQTFILANKLVVHTTSSVGTKTTQWVNLYNDPDKAQAALLGRTTVAELTGLKINGLWALPTRAGPTIPFWLLSLSQSFKIPDSERAILAIAEIVDDVIQNGERLK